MSVPKHWAENHNITDPTTPAKHITTLHSQSMI